MFYDDHLTLSHDIYGLRQNDIGLYDSLLVIGRLDLHWTESYCSYARYAPAQNVSTRHNSPRPEMRPTVPRPRRIPSRPRRDRDETLVRLQTVSRLRPLDRNHRQMNFLPTRRLNQLSFLVQSYHIFNQTLSKQCQRKQVSYLSQPILGECGLILRQKPIWLFTQNL